MVRGREDIHTRTVTVLRSLGRLFTRPHDQLALPLDTAPRNATELLARLRALPDGERKAEETARAIERMGIPVSRLSKIGEASCCPVPGRRVSLLQS